MNESFGIAMQKPAGEIVDASFVEVPLPVAGPAGLMVPVVGQDRPFDLAPVRAALAQYDPQIKELKAQAAGVEVWNDESQRQAISMAAQIKKLGRQCEEARKQFVSAPNEFIKAVNAMAKNYTAVFTQIENGLKAKVSRYAADRELERRKAEAAARKAAEEHQKKLDAEAKAAGVAPVKVDAPVMPAPPNVVRTESGSAHTRKVWTFAVEHPEQVPREFLTVDEKAIRQAVNGGAREIPGVRIWEETTTVIR